MVYAAELRGRLLAATTARELSRRERAAADAVATGADQGPWDVLNAQEVYSVPALRGVADEYGIPLVLTLHGYPLFESLSEGYTSQSAAGPPLPDAGGDACPAPGRRHRHRGHSPSPACPEAGAGTGR